MVKRNGIRVRLPGVRDASHKRGDQISFLTWAAAAQELNSVTCSNSSYQHFKQVQITFLVCPRHGPNSHSVQLKMSTWACQKRARVNSSARWGGEKTQFLWIHQRSPWSYLCSACAVRTWTGNIFYRAQNKNKVHAKNLRGQSMRRESKAGVRLQVTAH